MSGTTAEAAASVWINPLGGSQLGRPDVVERYVRRFSPTAHGLSLIKPEASIKDVRPIPAAWLDAISKRIGDSIASTGNETKGDGSSLTVEIADSARSFFETTSDILPCEPFIYSSHKGDLVVEFEAPYGRLTTVISRSSLIAFAVLGEVHFEKHIELVSSTSNALRNELQKITGMLRTGQLHGEVEPAN
jgi:hypothetical protein